MNPTLVRNMIALPANDLPFELLDHWLDASKLTETVFGRITPVMHSVRVVFMCDFGEDVVASRFDTMFRFVRPSPGTRYDD